MDSNALIEGLISYLCFLPALAFHECAHAWMANKCGDDTARLQGRITLNPVAHMDPIGTVLLPLLSVFLAASHSGASSFIIGWGKPVPVDIYNLRNRRRDDILVSLAGPISNLILATILMFVARLVFFIPIAPLSVMVRILQNITIISLLLCFFNLLPIPPLDGSHVVKNIFRMSDELYLRISQFGFILVIIAIQIPFIQSLIYGATILSYLGLLTVFQLQSLL